MKEKQNDLKQIQRYLASFEGKSYNFVDPVDPSLIQLKEDVQAAVEALNLKKETIEVLGFFLKKKSSFFEAISKEIGRTRTPGVCSIIVGKD